MAEYRYAHFYGGLLEEDAHFRTGPEPGNRIPEVERDTVDGERIRIGGRRSRPMLLVFGSITDPMTAAAIPILRRLHKQYGELIDFVTLYVRESNPGSKIPQPSTFDEKREHARMLRDEHDIPWPVAVDDLEGSLHRRLDPKPSAAYLVDHNGTVMFRSLWSDDPRSLRLGLDQFFESGEPVGDLESLFFPLLRGLWHADHVLEHAGPDALRDLKREAPLMYWAVKATRAVRHPLFPVALLAIGVGVAALRARR